MSNKIFIIALFFILTSCEPTVVYFTYEKESAKPIFSTDVDISENLNFKTNIPLNNLENEFILREYLCAVTVICPSGNLFKANSIKDEKRYSQDMIQQLMQSGLILDTISKKTRNQKDLFFAPNMHAFTYDFPIYDTKFKHPGHIKQSNGLTLQKGLRSKSQLNEQFNISKKGKVIVPFLSVNEYFLNESVNSKISKRFTLSVFIYEDFELKYVNKVVLSKTVITPKVHQNMIAIHPVYLRKLEISPLEFEHLTETVLKDFLKTNKLI